MSRRTDNQIIGVCRFSYLGTGGFQALRHGPERAAELLYAPARMKRRFAYFEHICLPSLAAQTDTDFRLVVLIADTMPTRWRKRLKLLWDRYEFLELCIIEAAGPLNSSRRAFKRGWDRTSPYVTGFRIDDDDAVSVDYIAKTREIADQLLTLGWANKETPAAVCFHRGIYWDMNSVDEPFWDFSENQPLGLASAMVMTPDAKANIFRWNHRLLASQARCWIDPHEQMFLRTLHGHNDSGRSIPPGAIKMGPAAARQIMRDRFGLMPKRIETFLNRFEAPEE